MFFPTIRRTLPTWQRSRACFYSTFAEGDYCMMRELRSGRKSLVGPLENGLHRDFKGGLIHHKDLIGQPARTIVRTHNGAYGFMLHEPTLEEYVVNVPRNCTPIYPKDASAIVQMLDIDPGQRILEAGTGNGALTLYLARAVHGPGGRIDTFDVRESHANMAKKHIHRFRRGKYRDTVAFHIGSVADAAAPESTYDGIVLDMPDPSVVLESLLPSLCNDRFIVCYLPNMTQVLDLAQTIRSLPLVMEDCIESEWKEWEVRATVIRAKEKENEKHDAWVCRPKNFDVKGHTAFLVKLRKCAPTTVSHTPDTNTAEAAAKAEDTL